MITNLLVACLIEKYGEPTESGIRLSVTDQDLLRMDASRYVHEWYDPLTRRHCLFLTRPVIDAVTVDSPPELTP